MSHGGPIDVHQQIFVLNIFSVYSSSPSQCPASDADSGSGIGVTADLLTFHWSTYLTFWLLSSHWLESRDNSEKGECPSDIQEQRFVTVTLSHFNLRKSGVGVWEDTHQERDSRDTIREAFNKKTYFWLRQEP